MTVEIVFPLLVLAASAAIIAFAISYRTRPRGIASGATAVAAFAVSSADAAFIDPPKAVSEATQAVATPATQETAVQSTYVTQEVAFVPVTESTPALSYQAPQAEPVAQAQAAPAEVQSTGAEAPHAPKKRERSHTSQGRRTRKRAN